MLFFFDDWRAPSHFIPLNPGKSRHNARRMVRSGLRHPPASQHNRWRPENFILPGSSFRDDIQKIGHLIHDDGEDYYGLSADRSRAGRVRDKKGVPGNAAAHATKAAVRRFVEGITTTSQS